jgi:hypothetical protein
MEHESEEDMKTNADKLRLIAEYVKNNTSLPVDVEEFLLEMAKRADTWGGNIPYKPRPAVTIENEPRSTRDTIPAGLKKIFDNMDKDMNDV